MSWHGVCNQTYVKIADFIQKRNTNTSYSLCHCVLSADRSSDLATKGSGPQGIGPCMEYAELVPRRGMEGVAEDQFDDTSDLLLKLGTVGIHEEVGTGERFANVLSDLCRTTIKNHH
jgi:hypothetical protein